MKNILKSHKLNILENKKHDSTFLYINSNFAIYTYNIKTTCRYNRKEYCYNMVYNF